jgi:hypothetical protein
VSEDAGATWQSLRFEGEIVSAIRTGSGGTIYAYVLGRGLVKSSEGNAGEWSPLSNAFGESIPLHIAIDPQDSAHLALTTRLNAVMESRDGGLSWHPFGAE